MPKSSIAALLAITALSSSHAFQLPSSSSRSRSNSNNKILSSRHQNHRMPSSLYAADMTEVEKLRAAAAKAREEYEQLSKAAGKEIISNNASANSNAPIKQNLSPSEIASLTSSIDFTSGDAASQSSALDSLVDNGSFSLWKSAVRRTGSSITSNSNMMSLLRPFPVTLGTLESRTGGKVTGESLGIGGEGDVKFEDFQDLTVQVVLGSTGLGIASLALLPENIGATVCYLVALVPIAFIGVGSVAPGIIAGVITSARGKSEDEERRRERVCRHEAGHFLCGYLCGLPVKNYEIVDSTGVACVEFHTDGNGGELTEDDVAALSVVAMSGSVAEIIAYDKATGGENDLIELQNCFRKSKEFIGAARQQDLTRWGALTSYELLRKNSEVYEKLVKAFGEKKSLSECVSIIEASA
eukprot:g13523.t1 g13523   contig8:858511-859746(-)